MATNGMDAHARSAGKNATKVTIGAKTVKNVPNVECVEAMHTSGTVAHVQSAAYGVMKNTRGTKTARGVLPAARKE
jgi:hypothetical protein